MYPASKSTKKYEFYAIMRLPTPSLHLPAVAQAACPALRQHPPTRAAPHQQAVLLLQQEPLPTHPHRCGRAWQPDHPAHNTRCATPATQWHPRTVGLTMAEGCFARLCCCCLSASINCITYAVRKTSHQSPALARHDKPTLLRRVHLVLRRLGCWCCSLTLGCQRGHCTGGKPGHRHLGLLWGPVVCLSTTVLLRCGCMHSELLRRHGHMKQRALMTAWSDVQVHVDTRGK